MIFAGIDAGSRSIKIVLLDGGGREVVACGTADQGVRQDAITARLLHDLLCSAGLKRDDVACTVATGYGRDNVSTADAAVTEITCHARGVHHVLPEARSVIEIGGQDSKFLALNGDGSVRDFAMNDRCAAGTGRFLEMVAQRLELGIEQLGDEALRSRSPAAISSMCVVFAETEILGLLAEGVGPSDIVAGVQRAIALRICAMSGRNLPAPVVLTGGVAMIAGMDSALQSVLGQEISVAPRPQMTGALGAAILAARRAAGNDA